MLFDDLSYLEVQSLWVVVTSTLWRVPHTFYQLSKYSPVSNISKKEVGTFPMLSPLPALLPRVLLFLLYGYMMYSSLLEFRYSTIFYVRVGFCLLPPSCAFWLHICALFPSCIQAGLELMPLQPLE